MGAARPPGEYGPARPDRGREIRERLAAANGEERERFVVAWVRTHVAAVLGLADPEAVDADRPLPELGFDSLTAVDLRNRLGADTGLRLAPGLVFRYPTVASLARHLVARWEETGPAGDEDTGGAEPARAGTGGAGFTLGPLFARAGDMGRTDEFEELMRHIARFRPIFDNPDERFRPAHVRLARGSAARLVCFPTFAVGSGASQYARLAAASRGEHDVWVLPVPGFGPHESLPASVDVLAQLQADGVARCADGGPVVLLGYSAGGWIAHATAAALEARGAGPDAVVLLDSHWPRSAMLRHLHARIEAARRSGTSDEPWTQEAEDDTHLTALAHYTGLFQAWTPARIGAPTLLVRAAEAGFDDPPQDWRPRWHLPHTAVDTPGTHFSIIREHSAPVLRAVGDWLGGSHRDHDSQPPRGTQGA
ncbi:alpha/beta fold hydrolase (plasmid) [Embleya sp. NBC_00888]|nr:alpha/beta fold hydrolase [Embleya sp. NBC_00888]